MKKSLSVFTQIRKTRLIALLTPKSVEQCLAAYEILHSRGIILEIAFRSEFALKGIQAILTRYPEALVLAGTVMTSGQAESAIEAGVAGIISPDYITSVVDVCVRHDVMCVPGGTCDTGKQLVRKADRYKCTVEDLKERYPYQWIYKLFPAISGSLNNMDLVKAWRGPYPGLSVIYTGGVNCRNIGELALADPDGIFCGSALTRFADEPGKMLKDVESWINAVAGAKEKPETPSDDVGDVRNHLKVITFGEIMMRLSPPDHQRFIQADRFNVQFGGAEANTAVAFANYGLKSQFVTALPPNDIGQAAVNSLRKFGVETEHILRQGDRTGIYFLEYGASQRPSRVVYDRAGSSISMLRPGQIPWDDVFWNATWFHWSGITPALSNNAAEVTLEALKNARKHGVFISVDLNYRSKLWSRHKARETMTELMNYVDVCIGNEEDAEKMFDIKADKTDVESGHLDKNSYRNVAERLIDRFELKMAAITLRSSLSASDNIWSACLHNGEEFMQSREYAIHIVDRVGGGDSFSSGLIYGLINGMNEQEALDFGVAASCLKQSIPGDFNLVTVEEVRQLMRGSGAGRVQR